MAALHASLDARLRPESVARLVWYVVKDDLGLVARGKLGRVARAAGRWNGMTSMGEDFVRPVGGDRQVAATARLFGCPDPVVVDGEDPASLLVFASTVGGQIGFDPAATDFLADRLNRAARAEAGIELSKRQYNRRFRVLQRLTAKAHKLDAEAGKRQMTMLARSGFARDITLERFRADPWAACFVAYYTAKRKLRREFTLSGRHNPYDEIAALLFARCRENARTDWWLIALAYAVGEVLERLTDAQRGELLGRWSAVMWQTAQALHRVWQASEFDRAELVVRRGNDSSTWNLLCGAYNTARAAWLSCLAATGATSLLDVACPGKAMTLIAADLAAWHRTAGDGLHPDTRVWARLPLPWEVLDGSATCTRADVNAACADAGVDPIRNGWTAPKPSGKV
ncbi:MAG: hypothetical protein ACRD0P_28665, partial [Stackebrandtia sp.]